MPRPPSTSPEERGWYTTQEVAAAFELTNETIRNWISSGYIMATQVNTYFRIPVSEVQRVARLRHGKVTELPEPPV